VETGWVSVRRLAPVGDGRLCTGDCTALQQVFRHPDAAVGAARNGIWCREYPTLALKNQG